MISLVLILLAAVANAMMDKLEYPNILISIFKRSWGKDVTSSSAKKFLGWKLDPWHVAKSFMIVCLCFAIILYTPLINVKLVVFNIPVYYADLLVFGLEWNTVFTLFYHTIFFKKKER